MKNIGPALAGSAGPVPPPLLNLCKTLRKIQPLNLPNLFARVQEVP